MKFPASEFWSFSTEFYQLPDIENSCLHLQDEHQADVNILLYCCWTAQKQICLTEEDIKTLVTIGQPWQSNILSHLRAARHTLKTSQVIIPEELREDTRRNISEMELNAEHMAQLALEKAINLKKKTINKDLSPADCGKENLHLYCEQLEQDKSFDQEIDLMLQALVEFNQQASPQIASR